MNGNYTYYKRHLIFSLGWLLSSRSTAAIIRPALIPLWLWLGGFLAPAGVYAQDFFKKLESADKYFTQRIVHFPDGDLLIGNSSIEAVRTGDGGEIYMTRMDPCGNVEWSKTYRREQEYLELKDLLISETGEIYAYGSAYIGLDELIFILKLNARGNILQFRLFEPETVDHFSYNIDLKGDRLMAYGLILDFGTKKFGFVAMFDQGLNFKWGKKFSPFASSGGARITADNGFICRSDQYLYKLDANGELEWASELAANVYNSPVAGPLEVADGFILEATGDGWSFFYKVDLAGNLIWKSDQFVAKPYPADMRLLPNGQISAVYSAQQHEEQQLCRLLLAPDGQILEQEKLQTTISIKPGRVFQSVVPGEEPLVISANPDPVIPQAVEAGAFLLSSTPAGDPEACFEWVNLQSVQPNQVPMAFSPLDTAMLSTEMTFINNTNITPLPFEITLENACTGSPDLQFVQVDTFLECGKDWTVHLPAQDFKWEDGATENPRVITEPGTYTAKNEDCGAQLLYEYTLNKPSCDCPVYLPTAFSPNQDGRNDYLEFFTDCELISIHMEVYSRWGEEVFESKVPGVYWDGNYRGRAAPGGLYLVKVNYEWIDQDNVFRKDTLVQQVTLLR